MYLNRFVDISRLPLRRAERRAYSIFRNALGKSGIIDVQG